MRPIYAIGDIHGQSEELMRVLDLIEQDGGRDAEIVFLGDYCDRGPDTRGVMDILQAGHEAGRNWHLLLGNHDRMFKWFLQSPPRHDPHLLVGFHWFHERIGGVQSMESYGVTVEPGMRLYDIHAAALEAVPASHRSLLDDLIRSFESEKLFFVHAGVDPGRTLTDQAENDMVWIREPFLSHAEPFPKLIVHGHTAIARATHYGNRVNLDAGAGYGKPLAAAVFEGKDVWVLTPQGRQALTV